MHVNTYPLIVFVHVPKTAGSTIKRFLHMHTASGFDNIDLVIEQKDVLREIACRADWISGHISRERFEIGLDGIDRPIQYYSIIRNPLEQLISHINYSIHRRLLPEYSKLHNDDEQILDEEVKSTDFSDPDSVIDFLSKNFHNYMNIQSRLIVGEDVGDISEDEISFRLSRYDYVGKSSDIADAYCSFGFAKLSKGRHELRENVSQQHLNFSIFDHLKVRQFINAHHRHDLRLYAAHANASWPAQRRQSFRPAFLAQNAFTHENFDEQNYLYCNPDVAAAVRNGEIESGYLHFCAFGQSEQRMHRQWIFP